MSAWKKHACSMLWALWVLGCASENGSPAAGTAGAAGAALAGAGGAGLSAGLGGGSGASGFAGSQGGSTAGAAGSGTTAGSGGTAGDGASACVPEAARYAQEILPILQQRCGGCHTTPTQSGAPFSLLDYDTVVSDLGGGVRIADRVIVQLAAGSMPPAGNLRPTPDEHDQIVDWASCGSNTPAYPTALQANRPIFKADAQPPASAERIELTAAGFSVPDGTTDRYENFIFSNVVTTEKFVRRFDVTIDKSRVVHHITLHYAGSSTNYLYAWAPGTGAVQFPSGGLRIKPSDQFRLEIHYNNPTGEDVVDSSGALLFVDEPSGTEYAMLDPNTFSIFVPAASKGQAQVDCTANSDFTILAGMPHMHEIGESYSHTLQRMDGTTESIIELSGWSFDLQFFYEMNVQVKAGDSMRITCNYQNDKDVPVLGGLGTTAEMCYDFMYVTPATASMNCN